MIRHFSITRGSIESHLTWDVAAERPGQGGVEIFGVEVLSKSSRNNVGGEKVPELRVLRVRLASRNVRRLAKKQAIQGAA